MNVEQCRSKFENDFPPLVLREIVLGIRDCYTRAADDAYANFDRGIADDYYPIRRRALIEQFLQNFAHRQVGMSASIRSNHRDSSDFVLVRSGMSLITCSKTDGGLEAPRQAFFRESLASSNQLTLGAEFTLLSPEPLPKDGIYFLLTHGPADNDKKTMGHCQILLPIAESSKTVLIADLMNLLTIKSESVVDDIVHEPTPTPTLKSDVVRRDSESGS